MSEEKPLRVFDVKAIAEVHVHPDPERPVQFVFEVTDKAFDLVLRFDPVALAWLEVKLSTAREAQAKHHQKQ